MGLENVGLNVLGREVQELKTVEWIVQMQAVLGWKMLELKNLGQ